MARVKPLTEGTHDQRDSEHVVIMPSGDQLADSIQRKFERDVEPVLVAAEHWRRKSREADWVATVH